MKTTKDPIKELELLRGRMRRLQSKLIGDEGFDPSVTVETVCARLLPLGAAFRTVAEQLLEDLRHQRPKILQSASLSRHLQERFDRAETAVKYWSALVKDPVLFLKTPRGEHNVTITYGGNTAFNVLTSYWAEAKQVIDSLGAVRSIILTIQARS